MKVFFINNLKTKTMYIIKATMMVNGNLKTSYFENLIPTMRKDVMNLFTECWNKRSSALAFYDKDEADKFCIFLKDKLTTDIQVIKIGK